MSVRRSWPSDGSFGRGRGADHAPGGAGLATVLLGSVPPVDRDALTHHLAVPKLYLKQGGMVEIPWVPFSYYPMNLDLLYLVPLYFGHDIAAKYIHFGFALLTAAAISGISGDAPAARPGRCWAGSCSCRCR